MTNASLVVMAAGLGSRFGGVKQLAAVGPAGEVILDYTIRDAISAGVDEVILIVRNDILADTEDHVRSIHGADVPLTLVCQDDLGPPRDKPWGTVHAVLSAARAVTTPFILANADDYYGISSFRLAFDRLGGLGPDRGLLVAFEVGNTLPAHGSVTRGVCSVQDGLLVGIDETSGLHRRADSTIAATPDGPAITPSTPVSMNLWAFDPAIMGALQGRWDKFYLDQSEDPKSECLLPTEVSALMRDGYEVELISSPETWTGLTNPDDLETVRSQISELRN